MKIRKLNVGTAVAMCWVIALSVIFAASLVDAAHRTAAIDSCVTSGGVVAEDHGDLYCLDNNHFSVLVAQ